MCSLLWSSTHTTHRTERPCTASFHRKQGVTLSTTRSTERVMGCRLASRSTAGTASTAALTGPPAWGSRSRAPISAADMSYSRS